MHPVREVLRAFLGLGLTSFGGPVAHIGYFRTAFVVRRAWLTEQQFADLVAISQFLPGPASSQLGFALGLMRAGWGGAGAANGAHGRLQQRASTGGPFRHAVARNTKRTQIGRQK